LRSLTVTDALDSTLTVSQSGIQVTAGAAASFAVSGIATSVTAGTTDQIVVTTRDAFGNVVVGYTGTIAFTSSDPAAVLPAPYTFVPGDTGARVVQGLQLRTAGQQSVTATDQAAPSVTGSQTGITVNPAAATHLELSGIPSSMPAGTSETLTVVARDPFGNV